MADRETLDTEDSCMSVSIGPDDILELVLAGNVSSDKCGDKLRAWVEDSKNAILELKAAHNGEVRCITDIRSLANFDEGAVTIIRGLAGWEESKNIETAVIGGNSFAKMALRTIVVMTGRKNLKSFETREEALAWFKEEESKE